MKNVCDPFGKPLDIGVRVAYNLSGQVCLGIITEFKTHKPYDRIQHFVMVDRVSQFIHSWNDRVSKHSKVKIENVCVIE